VYPRDLPCIGACDDMASDGEQPPALLASKSTPRWFAMIGGALAVTGIVLAWLLSIGLGIILLVIGIILAAVSLVSVTYL